MKAITWLHENVAVYIGNATAKRDYRAQLRGNRVVLFWTIYLLVLVLIAGIVYSSLDANGAIPISELQAHLGVFYQVIMGLLGFMVVTIAPSLTATTIVNERMMKSLDLVLTSPMSFKHLLVGKLISSYRYLWMLLVLALPVTAVSIVLGGATWTDVLGAYIILSSVGLVVTSIGLLASAVSPTAVSAVLWTYLAVGVYSLVTGAFATEYANRFSYGITTSLEAAWVYALSPFHSTLTSTTYTTAFGIQIPNYLIAFLAAVFVSRLFVAAAGSALSGYGAREVRSFHVNAIVYAAVIGLLCTPIVAGMVEDAAMQVSAALVLPLLVFFPHLFASSPLAEKKFRTGALFSYRDAFLGSPAGALPFTWLLVSFFFLGLVGGIGLGSYYLNATALFIPWCWTMALVAFWWALGRFVSAVSEVRLSRILILFSMIMLFFAPLPILLNNKTSLEPLYILYPALDFSATGMRDAGIAHCAALLVFAAVFVLLSEWRRKSRKPSEAI